MEVLNDESIVYCGAVGVDDLDEAEVAEIGVELYDVVEQEAIKTRVPWFGELWHGGLAEADEECVGQLDVGEVVSRIGRPLLAKDNVVVGYDALNGGVW